MSKGAFLTKSKDFAVRIIKLTRYLQEDKHEYVLSKQILRSGTSIGANARESNNAQSRADFLSKLSIALKEADETQYWLRKLRLYSDVEQVQEIASKNELQLIDKKYDGIWSVLVFEKY